MSKQFMIDAILAHGRAYPHLWDHADREATAYIGAAEVGRAKVRTLVEFYRKEPNFGSCGYPLLFQTLSLLGTHNPAAYACLALYTWPDSERLVGMPVSTLRTLAAYAPNFHAAILLLPAATALSGTVPQPPDLDQTSQQTNQKT